mmetsp:Transcript_81105/g.262727  ORF Transcript_81105/g.262727 Transcript_81105/m.262727 type:complete len:274 (-) Transcript_81105:2979-3800(-)
MRFALTPSSGGAGSPAASASASRCSSTMARSLGNSSSEEVQFWTCASRKSSSEGNCEASASARGPKHEHLPLGRPARPTIAACNNVESSGSSAKSTNTATTKRPVATEARGCGVFFEMPPAAPASPADRRTAKRPPRYNLLRCLRHHSIFSGRPAPTPGWAFLHKTAAGVSSAVNKEAPRAQHNPKGNVSGCPMATSISLNKSPKPRLSAFTSSSALGTSPSCAAPVASASAQLSRSSSAAARATRGRTICGAKTATSGKVRSQQSQSTRKAL